MSVFFVYSIGCYNKQARVPIQPLHIKTFMLKEVQATKKTGGRNEYSDKWQ